MIVTENFKVGEHDFIRTYSNSGRYVVREGIEYFEACDPEEFGRQYIEGDLIPINETSSEEILNILLGADIE